MKSLDKRWIVGAVLVILSLAGIRPACAAGSANAAVDWAKAQVVTVAMTNFAFAPNRLILHRGTPYRLHLVNNGSGGHDFASRDFFRAVEVAPEDRTKIDGAKIELARDETADVRLVPITPGTYPIRCTHFLHALFGMKGEAVIN